jgi:chromosome partitioning protein
MNSASTKCSPLFHTISSNLLVYGTGVVAPQSRADHHNGVQASRLHYGPRTSRPLFPLRALCVNIESMILAIANQKGGVGKTTTAINLAAALANKGHKTLLLDLDPQSNSTLSFLNSDQIEKSVYDAMVDGLGNFTEIIRSTPVRNLYLAPARISLAKLESKLMGEIDSHFRLKDKMAPLISEYPYIVIDTPPTLGLITVSALVAATHVLVPIQSSYFALEGTDDLLETIQKVKTRANPSLQLLGILVTLHDRRTTLGHDIVQQIERTFGEKVFRTMITKSVRLEESPAYRESIFTYAPKSTGALEYEQLSREVLNREKRTA